MTITHLLEDFTFSKSGTGLAIDRAMLEEERLSAFEQGYQAGWDDSIQAAGGMEKKALDDIAKALSSISSSRSETYSKLLLSLYPLINNLVDSVLPLILRESLGIRIKSIIHDFLEKNEADEIVVSIPESQRDVLSIIKPHLSEFPVRFSETHREEVAQISVGFGGADELEIDSHHLVSQIKESIDQFFSEEVQGTKEKN